jgi:hypothetical protein
MANSSHSQLGILSIKGRGNPAILQMEVMATIVITQTEIIAVTALIRIMDIVPLPLDKVVMTMGLIYSTIGSVVR